MFVDYRLGKFLLGLIVITLKLRRPTLRSNTVVILPVDAPASLGDEAMLIACLSHASTSGLYPVIADFNDQNSWNYVSATQPENSFRCISLHKYIRSRKPMRLLDFIRQAAKSAEVWMLGADVLDGRYGDWHIELRADLIQELSRLGTKVRILGFSCHSCPSQTAIRILTTMPGSVSLHARDPFSYQRLAALGCKSLSCNADLAFLLEPDDKGSELQQILTWICGEKAVGRYVIGVNLARITISEASLSNEELVRKFADFSDEILALSSQFSLVFIPHDFGRSEIERSSSDLALALQVHAHIRESHPDRTFVVDKQFRSAQVKSIASTLDFVVTSRMHLAIAAIGSGVPAVCITYQDKFEGMLKMFNLGDLAISPERALIDGQLSKFFIDNFELRDSYRELIKASLDKVKKAAIGNFT